MYSTLKVSDTQFCQPSTAIMAKAHCLFQRGLEHGSVQLFKFSKMFFALLAILIFEMTKMMDQCV